MSTIPERLDQYATLLRIRKAAFRRNALITGGVFLILTAAGVVAVFLTDLNRRELCFGIVLLAPLGLGFIMDWVRHEILKGTLEFVDVLYRATSETIE